MDEKTQFVEATLDWAEDRMAHLIDQGLIQEALGLACEFREWMRAPLGFDHDLEHPP